MLTNGVKHCNHGGIITNGGVLSNGGVLISCGMLTTCEAHWYSVTVGSAVGTGDGADEGTI